MPLAYSSPRPEARPAFELDKDFSFSVTYDVFPEVKPGDWNGIEIELPQVAIAKADEERELDGDPRAQRHRHGQGRRRRSGQGRHRHGRLPRARRRRRAGPGQRAAGLRLRDRHRLQPVQVRRRRHRHEERRREDRRKDLSRGLRIQGAGRHQRRISVSRQSDQGQEAPRPGRRAGPGRFREIQDPGRPQGRPHGKNMEKRLEDRLRPIKEKAIVDALLERSEVELPASMVDAELEMRWRNFVQQTTGGDERADGPTPLDERTDAPSPWPKSGDPPRRRPSRLAWSWRSSWRRESTRPRTRTMEKEYAKMAARKLLIRRRD